MNTIIVNTVNDEADGSIMDGDISLRDALAAAESNDLIIFAEAIESDTIRLDATLGALTVAGKNIVIDGDVDRDGNRITISGDSDNDGNGDTRLLTIANDSDLLILDVTLTKGFERGADGANSSIEGRDGEDGQDGIGGINNAGNLTLSYVTLSDTTGIGGAGGAGYSAENLINSTGGDAGVGIGGILNTGTLIIQNTIFDNNSGTGGIGGIGGDGGPTTEGGYARIGENGGRGGDAASSIFNKGILGLYNPESTFQNGLADGGAGGIGGGGSNATFNFGEDGADGADGGDGGQGGNAATILNENQIYSGKIVLRGNMGNGGTGGTKGYGGPGSSSGLVGGADGVNGNPGSDGNDGLFSIGILNVNGATSEATQIRIVDTASDENDGDFSAGNFSLREAIDQVEDGGTIRFDSTVFAADANISNNIRILVTNGSLNVDKSIVIDGDTNGDGIADVTLDGSSQEFAVPTIKSSSDSSDLQLQNLVLTNAESSQSGYIIDADAGNLSILNSTVSDSNTAGYGVVSIASNVDAVIANSAFINNYSYVGAIDTSGNLTVINSTFHGNYGSRGIAGSSGAIYLNNSQLSIYSSTISGNAAVDGAGGIFNNGGTLNITNSIVAGNTTINSDPDITSLLDLAITNSNGRNIFGSEISGSVDGDIQLGVGNTNTLADVFDSVALTTLGAVSVNSGALSVNGGRTPSVPILLDGLAENRADLNDQISESTLGRDVDGDGVISNSLDVFDQLGARRIANNTDIGAVETNLPILTLNQLQDAEFGNRFNDNSDNDGIVSFVFTETEAQNPRLIFQGFDIDFDDEVEVLLNDRSLGFIDKGVDGGFKTYEFVLPSVLQQSGDNIVTFRQSLNETFSWGVTNLVLTEAAQTDFRLVRDVQESGEFGNNFNGTTDDDGSITFGFVGNGTTLQLDFNGFDIDTGSEVSVLLNGFELRLLPAGVNDGIQPYQVTIPSFIQNIGDNVLEFRQLDNPAFRWGVTDILLSEPPLLDTETTETDSFGNRFNGTTDTDGITAFRFDRADGNPFVLQLDGFDIDTSDEVEVRLNERLIGTLGEGVNNGLQSYVVPTVNFFSDNQNDSVIEFRQAGDPNFAWGVTNLSLLEADTLRIDALNANEFGNRFNTNNDEDGLLSFVFSEVFFDVDYRLTFNAFDIDFSDEVEILHNGQSLGFLDAGTNNGETAYEFILVNDPTYTLFDETIQFRQARDPNFAWGVTDLFLSPIIRLNEGMSDSGAFGNRFFFANNTSGEVDFVFANTGTSLHLSFDGFDIDFDDEVEVFLNDTSLGFLDAGVDNGLQSYGITLSAAQQQAGDNILTFSQARDPNFAWGVTELLLTDLQTTDVLTLSGDAVENGSFGNRFNGASNDSGSIIFSFENTGTAQRLAFDGFDIDFADEVQVLLNGDSLGFLDPGVNNGLQAYEFAISAAEQQLGTNIVTFQQARDPGFAWGVTNLVIDAQSQSNFRLLEGALNAGEFGNRFNGNTDADGSITFGFVGRGEPLQLNFGGFDIDGGAEVEVFLNGASQGRLEAGVDNGTRPYQIAFDPNDQTIGDNVVEFRQIDNPNFAWGVTDLLLTEIPELTVGTRETGAFGNRFNGQTDSDGEVAFTFAGTDNALSFSFDGFDIDTGNEVELFLNDTSLGRLDAGVDNGTQRYTVTISEMNQQSGDNILEFRQIDTLAFAWGVTDLELTLL